VHKKSLLGCNKHGRKLLLSLWIISPEENFLTLHAADGFHLVFAKSKAVVRRRLGKSVLSQPPRCPGLFLAQDSQRFLLRDADAATVDSPTRPGRVIHGFSRKSALLRRTLLRRTHERPAGENQSYKRMPNPKRKLTSRRLHDFDQSRGPN